MKRLMLVLILAFSISMLGQTDSANVDLNALVQEQIELARAKQEMESIAEKENARVEETVRQPRVIRRIRKETNESGFLWKAFVLVGVSIAVFGFIYLRRRKLSAADESKNLKRNIKVLREEQLVRKDSPYLKQIRNSLLASAGKGELSEEAITNAARKLRISKEEILLANRIHSYKMMNV